MAAFLESLTKTLSRSKLIQSLGKSYTKSVEGELRKYGLRFEDLMIETDDVIEALKRLPPEVLEARNLRVKRACDLAMKKTYLPEFIQAGQKPYESYLAKTLAEVRAERAELSTTGLEYIRALEAKGSVSLPEIASLGAVRSLIGK
eukprot:EC120482.1.p1 GENE.EC120482.1~~EC120482.1.p1  ORF type:complete len:146 (+),score=32.24 EC120482.1:60-497(+)